MLWYPRVVFELPRMRVLEMRARPGPVNGSKELRGTKKGFNDYVV